MTANVLCHFDDLVDGSARKFVVDGVAVAVVRIGENVYAINDTCSHANVSLSGGDVWCDELELECPKHGSAFSLETGEPSTLPATQPVAVYAAAVADGQVVVNVNEPGNEPDNQPGDPS